MSNMAAGFTHRPKGKLHLQYRPAVVAPLAERRSDTWIIFELAKRVGLGDRFWDGDIEAACEYEIKPSGISLKRLKAAPGGISVAAAPRYAKYAAANETGAARGFNTPDNKVEIYSHTFAAHGYPPLAEYVEPLISPRPAGPGRRLSAGADQREIYDVYPQPVARSDEPAQSRAGTDGRYSPENRRTLRHHRQAMDDHRKPARSHARQSKSHRRHRGGSHLLPAWLVAGM
jgi:anaerobic selenocysteine-containing dehydrogenase